MKKKLFLIFITCIPVYFGTAQKIPKAEKKALQCINGKLQKANIDTAYILESLDIYIESVKKDDIELSRARKDETDSILSLIGFFRDNHLNVTLMQDCMESACNFEKEKDTLSSFYQLWRYLNTISEHPEMLQEVSPVLMIETLTTQINDKDKEKNFYKVYSFIIMQGLIMEFDNYARKRNELKEQETKHKENQPEVFQIITDDDIETEEETEITVDEDMENN